jgi:hypothetical protein
MSDNKDQIESTADRIRDDLLTTLKELDRRRHQATDLHLQLEKHSDLLLMVGVGAVALIGVGLGVGAMKKRVRRKTAVKHRVQALARAWDHPERLATRAKDRPLPTELLRKVVSTFLITMATRYARQLAEAAMPPQQGQMGAQKAPLMH